MNKASLERVWRALVAVDHFLRHELAPLMESSPVIDPASQWTPIFVAARTLDEEQAFIPDDVYRHGKASLVTYLEWELNQMIRRVETLIEVRQAGGDEAAALDAVREQLQRTVFGFRTQLEPVRAGIEKALAEMPATTGPTHIEIGTISGVSGQLFLGQFGQVQASQQQGDPEVLKALQQLGGEIAASRDLADADKHALAVIVEHLSQQARQAQPNRALVKALGDGLMTTLRAVPDVAKAVATLAPVLGKWFGG